jgi:hypothetical protein
VASLSGNIIICEQILRDTKTDVLSAVNLIDTLRIQPGESHVRFYTLTFIYGYAGDIDAHTLSIRMAKFNGEVVAAADDYYFKYSRKIDPTAPGGLHLYTEFAIDTTQLEPLEISYVVWAFLDNTAIAKTPLMLRRN